MTVDLAAIAQEQRRLLAKARTRQLAPFALHDRPLISRPAELAAIDDWRRPPILVGDASFLVVGEDDQIERLIEVREQARLTVDGGRVRVLAGDDACVDADGVEIEVWAFDSAEVNAVGATTYAYDRSTVVARSAYVHATDESSVEAGGFADVTAIGQARITAHDWSTVYACEESAVTIGQSYEPDPLERAFAGNDRPFQMTICVLGSGPVIVSADSSACVLALLSDSALEADAAPNTWWDETIARTEAWLVEREVFGDPLARLQAARDLIEERRRQIEAAGTWRPVITPLGRKSQFAE